MVTRIFKMNLVCACIFYFVIAVTGKEFDDFDDDDFIPFTGERYDRFDWNLCSALDEREPGNVIASPVSVKLLLAMIHEASIGSTARELENLLQLKTKRGITRVINSALLKTLQAPNPNYNLEIGLRLYVGREFHPKNWYKTVLAQYYGAYIQPLNFQKPALAAKEINEWTNYATHGHIKNLISNEESLRDTVILLVSAIYFQGKWKSSFPVEDSYEGLFHSPDEPKPSRFMTQTGLFYYTESEELDAKLLRLPYEGNKFAMYILLPRRKSGLNQALKKVRPFILRRLMWQLEETSVSVTLPIFKFEFTMNLKKIIMDMGLKTIFSNFNEFRGFTPTIKNNKTELTVSNIFQKAIIIVNEQGTVAAAATDTELVNKLGIPDLIFNASHPFLFFIEDEITGTVIFEGKYIFPDVTSSELDITENEKSLFKLKNASFDTPKSPQTNKTSGTKPKVRRLAEDSSHHHRRKGNLDGTEWEFSKTP